MEAKNMEAKDMEAVRERYELARERIRSIREETFPVKAFDGYFQACASFVEKMCAVCGWLREGGAERAGLEELQALNAAMYEDILPERYGESFANPERASRELGGGFGPSLCVLAAELRSLIGAAYEQDTEWMAVYMELFLEIYGAFGYEWAENGRLPEPESIRRILYWFASDYAETMTEKRVAAQVEPAAAGAARIVMESDLRDLRYLYAYGEYVSDNELRAARYLNALPEEKINLMADTYTEGYRMGFAATGKDLSKKKTVGVIYHLGFERMIRRAVRNFEKMGLKPVFFRPALSMLQGRGLVRNGVAGANPNRQFDYDHKDDQALVLDRGYVNRRLEALRAAYETHREAAGNYAGPAVVEVFGETPFAPKSRQEACSLNGEQQALSVELRAAAMDIQMKYIPEEERSFTIIAFPLPEIGERYEEIFDEIIRINTLDYKLYQGIQQKLIDALDGAEYVEVKGRGRNRTDIKVMMRRLRDPEKETVFENCVADVNIPVGEVFTSPRLRGTEGVLHVETVFLNGLAYRDLSLSFRDGMVTDYSCANFETEEQNRRFVRDNVLRHHKTLPIGEFAIGTNTAAYVAARKYDIGAKLPVLIAEKMGPHFAVGDTCYAHAENLAVYNPDGREIVARDNEVSALRDTEPEKAYFNCHTDITLPYDGLGGLTAVGPDGARTDIILNGRFVLEGCEELNKPFENQE